MGCRLVTDNLMARKSVVICLVAPLPPPYGGIAHWSQMVLRHASRVDGVELVTVNTAPTWRSIHETGLVRRALGGALQLLRDCFRIMKTLSARRCDAVHLTTSGHLAAFRDLTVSYLAGWFGVGLVYHIRFGRVPSLAGGRSLEWRLIRAVIRRAAKVILIDAATFDAVRNAEPKANVVLIPNCVDTGTLPRGVPREEGTKVALFLGWVIPTKGIGELVDAWTQLNPAGWRLDIVGPFDEAYRDELLGGRTITNLRFVGQLPHSEAMRRMAVCDLFVLPSYTEGFPNVVVEAMALGRPIIATDVGAIPEMLEEGAGMLFRSKDADALIDVLDRVIREEPLRKRMADIAHERAMTLYTIDVVFQSYEGIWRSVSGADVLE